MDLGCKSKQDQSNMGKSVRRDVECRFRNIDINAEGLYSHPDLGNPDAEDFSCSESCKKDEDHTINITSDSTVITALTDPDPALRGKGSLFADSLDMRQLRNQTKFSLQISLRRPFELLLLSRRQRCSFKCSSNSK